MIKKFIKGIKGLDIFGHPVEVTYRGDSTVKSGLGGLVSLGAYVLIMINLVNRFIEFKEKTA